MRRWASKPSAVAEWIPRAQPDPINGLCWASNGPARPTTAEETVPMDVEQIRKQIEDAGKRHLAAAMAGDTETLDQLLADELLYTHSNGFTDADKAAYLAFIKAGGYGTQGMHVEHSVERIIVLSDDVAIVKGKQITNTVGEIGGKWQDRGGPPPATTVPPGRPLRPTRPPST